MAGLIGKRMREKRLEKGMSLRELAEKTGLTPSFLSQIERDLSEPSITSLRRIARVLDVPIFFFLLGDDDPSPVVRRENRRVLRFPNYHMQYELLSPDLNRKIEMMLGRLDPGAVSCDEPLGHPGEEVLFVVQGEMDIQVGEETYHLRQGDSIYYFSSIPHKITSTGQAELIFVSAITPPLF